MFRRFRFKLLSMAVCVFILSSNIIVGQAATTSIQDNYGKKIAIGLTSLNNISSLDFTLTENYYIKENNMVLNKGSKYKITLENSVFKLYQDGGTVPIASLDNVTICPNKETSFISFRKDTYMRYFSGILTFSKLSDTTFLPINKLGIEDYIKGVVPYESGESYPIEALKAQAVAARTYAMANLSRYSAYDYDLTDDTRCQVYRGYSSNFPNSNQAVDATKGQILTYNGAPICSYFSASNGGYTEDSANVWSSSLPYFKAKPDSFDTNYNWTSTFTIEQIDQSLKKNTIITASDKFKAINLDTIKTFESGRISNIEIIYTDSTGAEKTTALSKNTARTFLALKSALYTVAFDEKTNTYTFTGKGYGHGIGMSQTGSQNRAAAGQTYLQILKFYYDNAVIKYLASDTVPNDTTPTTPTKPTTPTTPTSPVLQTGWVTKEGKIYYMDAKGVPVLSRWVLNNQGCWTYLGSDGVMVTNKWQQDSSKRWFYLTSDGTMAANKAVQDSSKRWFYLGADGAMVTSKWVYSLGKWYYYGTDGAMVVCKWMQDSSKRWFYLGADGVMLTSSWTLYSGVWYYLRADGAMAVNTTVQGYKINSWGGSNKPVT